MPHCRILSVLGIMFFFATTTLADQSTTQPSTTKRLAFHYEMPKNDHARKHRAWNDKLSLQINILGPIADTKSEWENGLNIFKVRIPKTERELYFDINCLRNSGSISISKSQDDWMNDAKTAPFSIQTYWFDFDARTKCQRFVDYLRKNSESVTPDNPIVMTVDNNAFYRIVRLEHFVSVKVDEMK